MSTTADITLWCDEDERGAWDMGNTGDGVALTRKHLRWRGWRQTIRDGVRIDLCPEHAKEAGLR